MIALLKAWIASKLRVIEYAILGLILALTFYGGYHLRSILDEAAKNRHSEHLVAAASKIITETNIITKLVRDSHDSCANAAAPRAVLDSLQ